MACCRIHKETCGTEVKDKDTTIDTTIDIAVDTTAENKVESTIEINDISSSASDDQPIIKLNSTMNEKLSASTRLKSFLASSPYLHHHLPVLLARIDRRESSQLSSPSSQLARELEKKERVAEVLKEAIDTDPKVAELYEILKEEDII